MGLDDHSSEDREFSRRTLLALSSSGLLAAGAGCGGGGGDDGTTTAPSTETTTDDTTPSSTTDGTATSSTPTEDTTTTAVKESIDVDPLRTSPSSQFAPADGFANVDWFFEADDVEVYRVTSLEATGEGTLAEAVTETGPRVVVFEVGGVIDMHGASLAVREPHSELYVAGQTAPSPGITLNRGGLSTRDAQNVVVQHLRMRLGDDVDDGSDVVNVSYSQAENVIFDHCTATWSIDEIMSTAGRHTNEGPDTVTFNNNIIAEALANTSLHPESDHGYGSLIYDHYSPTIAGNLYATNQGRNPLIGQGCRAAVVNNLVYGCSPIGSELDARSDVRASFVGNRYRDTDAPHLDRFSTEGASGQLYLEDNTASPNELAIDDFPIEIVDEPPVWPEGLEAYPSADVTDRVLATVGARPADRTPHDARVVTQVRDRTGGIIDSQEEVGGYPDLEPTERPRDPPSDRAALAEWLYEHARAVELPDVQPPD